MNDYVFSWAENDVGQMVHVDSVPNGIACNCHCPRCKEPLLARHGKVLAHGFAHHSEDRAANLDICYQVILYKLAEHIVQTAKHIHAPTYYGIYPEKDIWFTDVKIDGQYERADKQPDVVATAEDGTQYLVEFTFDHKVQHKQPVDYSSMNCIEVTLKGQTLESLENFLLNKGDGRKWVNNEKYFTSIDRLYQSKGKSIRITQEKTCASCPIKENCSGAALNGVILKIENNGNVYRLCKTQEYDRRLKWHQEEERRKAEQERIKRMSLEERLLASPARPLMHIAYFSDGTVKVTEEWSSKDLHKKWYNESILEFTVDAGQNSSFIAAMYIRHRGYALKDCIICQFCHDGYCSRDVEEPNAWTCRAFTVSSQLRFMVAKGFSRWVVET